MDGVIRFKIADGANVAETSSSGLNSEYGSYPSSITSLTIDFKAVKNNNSHSSSDYAVLL